MLAALTIGAVGVVRIHGSGLTFVGMDHDQVREYIFHIAAGMFFGWSFHAGVGALADRTKRRAAFGLAVAASVSPLLFLVLAHQTRATINDGPATLGLAAGLALAVVAGAFREKKRTSSG